MTILVVPLQHRFAGTSRSRHRARFIPMPASAGGRTRTSPQSSHRVQKQRPIRNHQRLSALRRSSQNHPRLRPLRRQIPIVARRSPPSRGFVHRRLSDAGPYTGSIARAGPASETLPDSRHPWALPVPAGFDPFRDSARRTNRDTARALRLERMNFWRGDEAFALRTGPRRRQCLRLLGEDCNILIGRRL